MIMPYKMYSLAMPFKLLAIFLACLMTASGQGVGSFCQNVSAGDYANISFCLPSEALAHPGAVVEENYSQGRDVNTSMLLSGNNIRLRLLYPCRIEDKLGPSEIRAFINAFDPQIKQARYSSTPLNISGRRAVWGELKNRTFAAYQPSNKTIAIIIFDEGLPYAVISSFLNSLKIDINDSHPPQTYCQPPNASPRRTSNATNLSNITTNDTAKGAANNTAKNITKNITRNIIKNITRNITKGVTNDKDFDALNLSSTIANDTAKDKDFGPDIEAMMTRMEVSQEALMAEQEAARARSENSAGMLKEDIANR